MGTKAKATKNVSASLQAPQGESRPERITDKEAAALVEVIMPDIPFSPDNDPAAFALIQIIKHLTYSKDHLERELDYFTLRRAIFSHTDALARAMEFFAESGNVSPLLSKA